MNKGAGFILFMFGGVVGSFITWRALKERYTRLAQKEIDSVKETFERKRAALEAVSAKPPLSEYIQRRVSAYAGDSQPDEPEEGGTDQMEPYIISPSDFEENDDYQKISLTYYADHILVDDEGEIVSDVEELVGDEALEQLDNYGFESVCVRNERLGIDYEVLADEREYSDVVGHIRE